MAEGLTERSAQRTRDLLERLRGEYGDPEVVEKTWRHPPHFYEQLVERFEAGHAGGAGAWVYDDAGRVLLVREGAGTWTDPGGKRDPGESFADTATRVLEDDVGVAATVTGVLELHRIEVYDGTDPDRPTLVEPIVVFHARFEREVGEEAIDDRDGIEWFAGHPPNVQYEDLERRPIPFEP